MHDGRCWYLTCFRKIHFDAAKASSSNSNVQLQLFTTKGGVRGYTLHSWDAECIDTMTPSVQASKRAERNNNTIPRVCVYRKGGEKATCCSSFPQQSVILMLHLGKRREGAGRLNVSSILARRQPQLRPRDIPTVIMCILYFVQQWWSDISLVFLMH